MWFQSREGVKKKKKGTPAATWMELETLILSEVSRKEKDKYHMISLISRIYYAALMNLKETHGHVVAKGEGVGWTGSLG